MIQKLICFLITGLVLNAQAQDWFPIGAKWHYNTEICIVDSPFCGYFTLEVIDDTILNGQQARILKVEEFGAGSLYLDSLEIFYEDSNRVYRYFEEDFHLIYDLNLSIGDTLTIQDSIYSGFLPKDKTGSQSDTIIFQTIVDSIDTWVVDGVPLTVHYSHPLEDNNGTLWGFNQGIVERIGAIDQPLGMHSELVSDIIRGQLRCYIDDNISWKNPNFNESCEILTSLEPNLSSEIITIHYLTDTEELLFEFKNQVTQSVYIGVLSSSGQRIWNNSYPEGYFNSTGKISLPIANLANGIYICQIVMGKNLYTKKIIIYR